VVSCENFLGRLDALYGVGAVVEFTQIPEPTKTIAESKQSPQAKS
jgi:hypothetical protein